MSHREQRRSGSERLERNRAWVERLQRERIAALRRVARRHGIAAQDEDDVIQTALTSVLRAFPGPDEERAVFAYAARAVANTALKAHRRSRRKESRNVAIDGAALEGTREAHVVADVSDASAADPLERAIERERAAERRARLEALPAEERAALALAAAGCSPAEVAAALGLSVRQVRKRIENANRALRDSGWRTARA